MAMRYVKVYYDLLDALEALSEGERGRLMTAMLQHARQEEVIPLTGGERYLWPMVRAQIDRDQVSYRETAAKRSEAGALGGRPARDKASESKKSNCFSGKQAKATESKKTQDKDKEEDKEDIIPRTRGNDNVPFLTDDEAAMLAADLEAVLTEAQAIGIPLNRRDMDRGNELLADYGAAWVMEALRRAGDAPVSARSWRYVGAILRKWRENGGVDGGKKPESAPQLPPGFKHVRPPRGGADV